MATPRTPPKRRSDRERELVRATRRLFDERGMLDAPIEEIAQAVGIARGLIYRQFSSKEELFVLTVTDYLDELAAEMALAAPASLSPVERLERGIAAYADFCGRYPAFLDSSLSLMHRPAGELREAISESVWLRLGHAMAHSVDALVKTLEAGAADGSFSVADPAYTANVLWTQVLGAMHLARIRVGLHLGALGTPDLFSIAPERVARTCVESALATVGAQPTGS